MELVAVGPKDRELLWNIHQKYLYEMTNYYDDEMDALGNLAYGYFDAYFTDPLRQAFLLYEGQTLVGFAMIHPYSNLQEEPDHVLAEFTVFPLYRRRHLAAQAADLIFARFPGRWEVKYNEKNAAAKALWTQATERYHPQAVRLNEVETVLRFSTAEGQTSAESSTLLDAALFFDAVPGAYALYRAFSDAVTARWPKAACRVQKTQITFTDPWVFACVSLLRARRKAELPTPWITITLGLPYQLTSPRVAAAVEPYPGRWTTHIVVGSPEEIDEELLGWVAEAHAFAARKR